MFRHEDTLGHTFMIDFIGLTTAYLGHSGEEDGPDCQPITTWCCVGPDDGRSVPTGHTQRYCEGLLGTSSSVACQEKLQLPPSATFCPHPGGGG